MNPNGMSTQELEELMDSVDRYDAQESGSSSAEIVNNLKDETLLKANEKFDKYQRESRRISKNLIKKLVYFYLTSDMARDDYTIKKISVDVENLTNLYFQLKTSQYTIVRLLGEMETSTPNVKYLEIYNKLQLGNVDILKSIKQYCQLMEVEYQNFSKTYNNNKKFEVGEEAPIKKVEGVSNSINGSNTHRGSKSFIEEMRSAILEENVEVAKGVVVNG